MGDATVEALGVAMQQVTDGPAILVVRSELSSLLASFDRKGHEGDRDFYLEAHDGKTQHHKVNRITSGWSCPGSLPLLMAWWDGGKQANLHQERSHGHRP